MDGPINYQQINKADGLALVESLYPYPVFPQ